MGQWTKVAKWNFVFSTDPYGISIKIFGVIMTVALPRAHCLIPSMALQAHAAMSSISMPYRGKHSFEGSTFLGLLASSCAIESHDFSA